MMNQDLNIANLLAVMIADVNSAADVNGFSPVYNLPFQAWWKSDRSLSASLTYQNRGPSALQDARFSVHADNEPMFAAYWALAFARPRLEFTEQPEVKTGIGLMMKHGD